MKTKTKKRLKALTKIADDFCREHTIFEPFDFDMTEISEGFDYYRHTRWLIDDRDVNFYSCCDTEGNVYMLINHLHNDDDSRDDLIEACIEADIKVIYTITIDPDNAK